RIMMIASGVVGLDSGRPCFATDEEGDCTRRTNANPAPLSDETQARRHLSQSWRTPWGSFAVAIW
ncbi:MAG: hypothetical protein ABJA82_17600, partial [Myxococcales bacterium]